MHHHRHNRRRRCCERSVGLCEMKLLAKATLLSSTSVILILILWMGKEQTFDHVKRTSCSSTNLTLVSAFFDIGDHNKGEGRRVVSEYYTWGSAFAYIHTPLVFYTDSQTFAQHLLDVRSRLPPNLTHIVVIDRASLWPFKLRDSIASLYANPSYPTYSPNTVVPDYTCAMHSKYACLKDAILGQPPLVTSEYVAWIDIGYFRNLESNTKDYCLVLPQAMNKSAVLFNQLIVPNFFLTPREIFYKNFFWVGGGMFVAARNVMLKFCDEYQRAATFFLIQRQLSSTDQQTLYAAMTYEGRRDVNFTVDIQVESGVHDWFDLGLSVLRQLSS